MSRSGIIRILPVLIALGALAACDGLGPAEDLEVFVSVTPDLFVLLGDTAEIVGVAHNGSDARIDATGAGCGHGIRFLVTDSTGTETDLYDESSPGACTGDRQDDHDLEPGETEVVRWSWVPRALGVLYQARSGT